MLLLKECRAGASKHSRVSSLLLVVILATLDLTLYGQTEVPASPWTTGADLYSSYIWRGTRQSGPAVQPEIEFNTGFFTAGAWGSFDFNDFQEVDLYLSFALNETVSLGIQDYYFPGLVYFDYSTASGSHAFEVNLDYTSERVWLSANWVINEAGGIGSYGGDLYFEGGISFEYFSLFLGAGNGWHTEDGSFNACNLGLEVTEEIEVTDRFTIPVTGQLILNPDREQLFVTVGFAF